MATHNTKVKAFTAQTVEKGAGIVMPQMTKEAFRKAAANKLCSVKKGDIKPEPKHGGMNVNRFLVDLFGA